MILVTISLKPQKINHVKSVILIKIKEDFDFLSFGRIYFISAYLITVPAPKLG